MGSIDRACISGFLCRLCSEMHRTVIHIYGDHGKRLGLVEKINGYLPITISPTDPLPKTICESCLRRVEQHYDLLLRLSRIKEGRFLRVYKPRSRINMLGGSDSDISEDNLYASDDDFRHSPRGPFVIASTSLSSAANVSRSSPTTLANQQHDFSSSSSSTLDLDSADEQND